MSLQTLSMISFCMQVVMLVAVLILISMKVSQIYNHELHKWKVRRLRKLGLCGKDFTEDYLRFIKDHPETMRSLLAHTEIRLDLMRKAIREHLVMVQDPAFQALIEADEQMEHDWLVPGE